MLMTWAVRPGDGKQLIRTPRCLIPRFDGAILSKEWNEALWHKFVTGAHAVRTAIQGSQVEVPLAIGSSAGLRARAAEQGIGHQPQDCGKVAEAGDGRGYDDRADGTALDGFDRSRGSGIVPFRRHTLLPLDDCLYALRSALHSFAAYNDMASRGCRMSRATSPSARSSGTTPSGSSTPTSLR